MNARQWTVPLRGTVEKWGIHGLTTDSARPYYTRAYRRVGFDRQRVSLRHIYAEDFIKAAEDAGYPLHGDPFDTEVKSSMFENRVSVSRKGTNVNSCDVYLNPVKSACAGRLEVRQGVTVTKLLLEKGKAKSNVRATGVEYVRTSEIGAMKNKNKEGTIKRRKLLAKRMVICAAGPYGTPKLLQLSGIGPRSVLHPAGISQVVDLPVGLKTQARNFVSIHATYKTALEPSNNSTLVFSPAVRAAWEAGNISGDGSVLGKLAFFANGRDSDRGFFTGLGHWFPSLMDHKVLGFNCNGNVDSRGYLKIASSNPFAPPRVNFALLREPDDVERLKKCLKNLVRIVQNFPKKLGVQLTSPPITERFIRNEAEWGAHFVGGCPVGEVLTDKLQVKGVEGLKVIDASSLRNIPTSAGPMSSVYMLAEYMSEVLAREI